MEPRLRDLLRTMTPYRPGRRPAEGQVAARLASNETPYPPLPSVVAAITAAGSEGNRYPDPQAVRLTAAIAAHHGVRDEQVAVGCGSVALVQQIVQSTCDAGDEVVYGWRSFESYPLFAGIAGARSVEVPLVDEALDLEAIAAAVGPRTRLVLLCTPNNPTGPALAAGDVKSFLDSVRDDVVVVLDEAYAEFVREPGAVDGRIFLDDRPNIAVLRTFSKAYGLAGLRVGYCLSHPAVATALRSVQVPFSVSSVAQAAALASLAAHDELTQRVEQVVAERARVAPSLRELGYAVPDAQGNFVWLPLRERSAAASAAFDAHDVLVRCFAGDGLRITVADPASNDALLAAAAAIRDVALG
ncbi:MAG TPA: histidinol-phosphate transaminase [Mycobacteriales bacterium]|nr:histidinol-phosphate transaminase [Mycobacteriales bacterium]